jgi:arginyl-tRNA synthetase
MSQAKIDGQERGSIMSRGFTNVKNLLTNVSPLKLENELDKYSDAKNHTKASMNSDSNALIDILRKTISETEDVFSDFDEVEYVFSNCSDTFKEQSMRYEKLATATKNVFDEDVKTCFSVTKTIFDHLSTSFKRWDCDSDVFEENKNVRKGIDEISSKCELELKLFKNELECFDNVSQIRNKNKANEAFNGLCKKYDKYLKCLVDSIGRVVS